jgi:predicted acyltransferase
MIIKERIASIDALRGFDMFWIAGGEGLINSLHTLMPNAVTAALDQQFTHVDWEGFHFYDLIFPLFLFLVGVVLPFSLGSQMERGVKLGRLYWRAFRRLILLLLLGLVHNGLLYKSFHDLRLPGVLQRIAVCYFVAAIVVIHFRPRGQAIIGAALLLGYWALMAQVPLTPAGNLSAAVDRQLISPPFCCYTYGDNEGILSTIPAIGTALMGALAGAWLRSARPPAPKAVGLALAGIASLGAGLLWGVWFPIIKNIWTSSFVLYAGGWSLLLLALFYWVIDIRGWRRWSFFFAVIGMNAITIYVLRSLIGFPRILEMNGLREAGLGDYTLAFWRLVDVAAGWLLLWVLYRKRLFLRV